MSKPSQNSPVRQKSQAGSKQQSQDQAAKQHDRESPESRGQAANTKINTTGQRGNQGAK